MLPMFIVLASCGGAASDSDGIDQVNEEKAKNKNFILIQNIVKDESGQRQYIEIKKIEGDACNEYWAPEHEWAELIISLKNDVSFEVDELLNCLEDQKFNRDTFSDDEEVFKTCIEGKSDQEFKVSQSSSLTVASGKVTFGYDLY